MPPDTVIQSPSQPADIYHRLVGVWFAAMQPYAQGLFYVLALIDLGIFGWDLWRHHSWDIRSATLATANKVLIIGRWHPASERCEEVGLRLGNWLTPEEARCFWQNS
jgi:hypothetical protein